MEEEEDVEEQLEIIRFQGGCQSFIYRI